MVARPFDPHPRRRIRTDTTDDRSKSSTMASTIVRAEGNARATHVVLSPPERAGVAAKNASGAESALAGRNLGRRLASEQQMGEVGSSLAGAGSTTKLRAAQRLADDYGGAADDWAKMGSSSYRGSDGFAMETHWYEHVLTGQRFEFKTKMLWLP